jgi:uncharacterized protein YjiS (DUF1127 family)
MNLLSGWVRLRARREKMDAYVQAKTNFLDMTDADLADIGAKRYQIEGIARR